VLTILHRSFRLGHHERWDADLPKDAANLEVKCASDEETWVRREKERGHRAIGQAAKR
jgi:hypothetical protein